MCGGVIVITATIPDWTVIIDASPSCTIGSRLITTHDRLTDLIGCERLAVGSIPPDMASGSGRSRTQMIAAAASDKMAANAIGPTLGLSPT